MVLHGIPVYPRLAAAGRAVNVNANILSSLDASACLTVKYSVDPLNIRTQLGATTDATCSCGMQLNVGSTMAKVKLPGVRDSSMFEILRIRRSDIDGLASPLPLSGEGRNAARFDHGVRWWISCGCRQLEA